MIEVYNVYIIACVLNSTEHERKDWNRPTCRGHMIVSIVSSQVDHFKREL